MPVSKSVMDARGQASCHLKVFNPAGCDTPHLPVGNISFMYATASKSSLSKASCCALGLINMTPLDAAGASAALGGLGPSVTIAPAV